MKSLLTRSQISRLANIFDNAGQICFGSVIIGPLVSKFDAGIKFLLLYGILITLLSWWLSLRFERIADA